MHFKDVTTQSGLAGEGYSIGAAAADFDNDGHVDLFVAGVRGNHLYRNRGNGTFEDVTRRPESKMSPGRLGRSGLTTTMTGCSTSLSSITSSGRRTSTAFAEMHRD